MTREQMIDVMLEAARAAVIEETGITHPVDFATQMVGAIESAGRTLDVLARKGFLK